MVLITYNYSLRACSVSSFVQGQSVSKIHKLDFFSRSRVINFSNRSASSRSNGDISLQSSTTSSNKFFVVTKNEGSMDEMARVRVDARLEIPADYSSDGVACACVFTATGFAASEKDAVAACSMHAERILDELGIPIFALPSMQAKHAEAARQEGRSAPMPGERPRKLSDVALPFPLLYDSSLQAAAVAAAGKKSSERIDPSCGGSSSNGGMKTFQGSPTRRYLVRVGNDPLNRGSDGQVEFRRAAVFTHTQDWGTAAEGSAHEIDEGDVELLGESDETSGAPHRQQQRRIRQVPHSSGAPASAASSRPLPLARESLKPLSRSHIQGIDESEHGQFALCEVDQPFYNEKAALTIPCLYSPYSLETVRAFYLRHHDAGRDLDADIVWAESEELTRVSFGEPLEKKKWFVCSVNIPGTTPPVEAKGKATTKALALGLMAMHFELLVDSNVQQQPLFHSEQDQALHHDALLRFGRQIGSPVKPLPLKEWVRPMRDGAKSRLRTSSPSLDETFVSLHRRIVTTYRQHLVEVDLDQECEEYAEAKLLVRQFMMEHRYPRELQFLSFMYSQNQFRTSLHLPVPSEFGIRGAYAIGHSIYSAEGLCAMHALDVLCTLGIPLLKDPGDNAVAIQRRVQRGRIVPPLDGAKVALTVRSPPGYREAPGAAARVVPSHDDVWNVMMTDAAEFDIVEDFAVSRPTFLPADETLVIRSLFHTFMSSLGLTSEASVRERMRHYCGVQRNGLRRTAAANNYWLELPVSPHLGRRVALGRCISRKGAERSCMIHALRIANHLGLFPAATQSSPPPPSLTSSRLVSTKASERKSRDQLWWELFRKQFCQMDTAAGSSAKATLADPSLGLGGCMSSAAPSPNPVMSQALALITFRR